MNLAYPIPEAIDGRSWTVAEGSGSVDLKKRRMEVPLGHTAADRSVRLHEMGHAKITPRQSAVALSEKYGVSYEAMQWCEDGRVSLFLESRGLHCDAVLTAEEADSLVVAYKDNSRRLGSFLIGTLATGDHPNVVAALEKHVPEKVNRLLDYTARIVHRLQGGRNRFRPIGFRNCTVPAARLFDALFPEIECPLQVPLDAMTGRGTGRRVPWGKMTLGTLPMPLTRPLRKSSTARVFTDEGCVFAAPHRLLVDERVFVRRRRQPGGTLLVDGSGSMNFSAVDLEHFALAVPAATVAVYSGHGKAGQLTVVSQKGRVATADGLQASRKGAGNIIDGPALQWLSKQQQPRLWLSDGQVTGINDHSSPDLAVEAQMICHRGGIRRVSKPEALNEFLRAARSRT